MNKLLFKCTNKINYFVRQKEKGSIIKSKAGIGLISIIIGMTIFATFV